MDAGNVTFTLSAATVISVVFKVTELLIRQHSHKKNGHLTAQQRLDIEAIIKSTDDKIHRTRNWIRRIKSYDKWEEARMESDDHR